MKKTLLSLLAITALIIAGCSKDDDNGSQEKMILGKWTPESTRIKVTDKINGGSATSDKPVYANDYFDFRSDGKLYTSISDPSEGPGYDPRDTTSYRLAQNYLIIDGDSLALNTLNNNSLVFTLVESDQLELWETTFSLKK
jgi:hypothetical protein